jgi:hypothetical protein
MVEAVDLHFSQSSLAPTTAAHWGGRGGGHNEEKGETMAYTKDDGFFPDEDIVFFLLLKWVDFSFSRRSWSGMKQTLCTNQRARRDRHAWLNWSDIHTMLIGPWF